MPSPSKNTFNAAPGHQPLLRELGLDAESVFTHPDIQVWRSLPERENCTLDADLSDGRSTSTKTDTHIALAPQRRTEHGEEISHG